MKTYRDWNTTQEVDYLNNIGTEAKSVKTSREQLLRRYISAGEKRGNWDKMDCASVLGHARRLLNDILKRKENGK